MRKLGLALAIVALSITTAAAQTGKSTGGQAATIKPKPSSSPSGVMTWDKVSGNWKSFRGRIRQQWGKLTHNDLQVAQGKREVLVGRIQARYGIDKEKADRQVDTWLKQQK